MLRAPGARVCLVAALDIAPSQPELSIPAAPYRGEAQGPALGACAKGAPLDHTAAHAAPRIVAFPVLCDAGRG